MEGIPKPPPGQPGAPGTPPPQPPPPGQPGAPTEPGTPAAGQPVVSTNPHERIDALQSWISDVERKLGIRTWIGIGLGALALAVAIFALLTAMQAKDDSATKSDVQDLREQVATVEESAGQVTDEDLKMVTDRLSALEDQIGTLTEDKDSTDQEISVLQDDIQDLRDQIASLESGGGAGTSDVPGSTDTGTSP